MDRFDVLLQRLDIERFDRLGVIEICGHRVGSGGVAAQGLEADLLRPPVLIRRHVIGPFRGAQWIQRITEPARASSIRSVG